MNISAMDGNTSTNNVLPQIYGCKIVWRGNINGETHIFCYDSADGTVSQIPSPRAFNTNPRIWGNKVVFMGANTSGQQRDVYLWDGTSVIELSDLGGDNPHTFSNTTAQLEGDNVVWLGNSTTLGHRIYLYDGNSTIPFTSTDGDYTVNPQLSIGSGRVAYRKWPGAVWGKFDCISGPLPNANDSDGDKIYNTVTTVPMMPILTKPMQMKILLEMCVTTVPMIPMKIKQMQMKTK